MHYKLTALTGHDTGAETVGLDLKAPVGADLRQALNAEFAKYHLLVFREQELSAAEFAGAGEIFGEVMSHATQKKHEYRHQWRYGDLVIWDNRSVMRQANGDYDMSEVRHLHRIMIKGEPVIAAQPAASPPDLSDPKKENGWFSLRQRTCGQVHHAKTGGAAPECRAIGRRHHIQERSCIDPVFHVSFER